MLFAHSWMDVCISGGMCSHIAQGIWIEAFPISSELCCLFIFFLGDELLERQTSIYFQKQQLTAVELLKYKSTHNSNWICWTVVCASRVVVLYPFVAHPSPQQHFEDSTSANSDQLVSSDQNVYDDISNSRAHLHAHDFAHNMPAF